MQPILTHKQSFSNGCENRNDAYGIQRDPIKVVGRKLCHSPVRQFTQRSHASQMLGRNRGASMHS